MSGSTAFQAVLLAAFLYLSVHYVLRSLLALGAALRTASNKPLGDSEPAEVVAVSRFSIPVSVVIVANGDAEEVTQTLESALRFHYPTFEVVVVSDDAGEIPASWQRAHELEPCEVFFRRQLVTQPVRRIYRSGRGTRLLVVSRDPGSRGDALNCAVNFSRYRYVCCLTNGLTYDADALIRLMRPVAESPATNIGAVAASSGASGPTPETEGATDRPGPSRGWLGAVSGLVARSTYNAMTALGVLPPSTGGAAVWRRDTLVEQGGFAGQQYGEYVDLWLRLKHGSANLDSPRVLLLSDGLGYRPGGLRLSNAVRQSAEAQAGVMKALQRAVRRPDDTEEAGARRGPSGTTACAAASCPFSRCSPWLRWSSAARRGS